MCVSMGVDLFLRTAQVRKETASCGPQSWQPFGQALHLLLSLQLSWSKTFLHSAGLQCSALMAGFMASISHLLPLLRVSLQLQFLISPESSNSLVHFPLQRASQTFST